MIHVTNTKNGKTVTAKVRDLCESCSHGTGNNVGTFLTSLCVCFENADADYDCFRLGALCIFKHRRDGTGRA